MAWFPAGASPTPVLGGDAVVIIDPATGLPLFGVGSGSLQFQGNAANAATDTGNPVKVGGVFRSTPSTLANGQRGDMLIDVNGRQVVVAQPNTAATSAIVPVVGVGGSSLVLKASAGNFYSASMTAGATAGFFILYNATAAPAGGASLTASLVMHCVPVAANGWATLGGTDTPDRLTTGGVLLFSTASTTYTVPGNLALHMRGCMV